MTVWLLLSFIAGCVIGIAFVTAVPAVSEALGIIAECAADWYKLHRSHEQPENAAPPEVKTNVGD